MNKSALIQRWQDITATLKPQVRLIAVSKQTTNDHVATLLEAGQRDFAEARPQNLRDRAMKFPQANWHMIGPLQKNKAKYVGKFACMWHSCCDIETAAAVAKHLAHDVLPTLVQVNISGEPQKQGVLPEALPLFLKQLEPIEGLKLVGLMGMAAKHSDPRDAFASLKACRDQIITEYPMLQELCMGMSNDWHVAIQEGATMIRIGSQIFDQR